MEFASSVQSQTSQAVAHGEPMDAFAPIRGLLKAALVAVPALLGILALWAATRS